MEKRLAWFLIRRRRHVEAKGPPTVCCRP